MEPDRTAEHPPEEDGLPEEPAAAPQTAAAGARATVELVLDEASGVLTARVSACEGGEWVTLEDLQQQIETHGYGEFNFEPDALNAVLRYVLACQEGDYTIAVRRDAEVSVSPTVDKLQALLTTTRAYGGMPVTEERVLEAVKKARIEPSMLRKDAIAGALSGPPVTNVVIAEGVAPRSGVDSRIEILVDLDSEATGPREREGGRVDHYSVRDFLIVDEATHLMRRYPATKGVPGRDVLGKPITARDGKDHPLPKEMPGVRPHEEDAELMVADYKGHPVLIPGGIRVDKTLVMEHVDLRTGNVDFDGSVLVKGDVAAGVTVKATGDITVKGTVENAFVLAGSSLLIARGFTGSDSAMQGGKREVRGEAGADFQAGFAAGVKIRAGGNVVVKEYLNHCETLARAQIRVGQTGGRGLVVGGTCHGCQGVQARVLGTMANVPTEVRAGPHEQLDEAREEVLNERQDLVERLDQLKAMLANMTDPETQAEGERQNLIDKVRRTIEDFERRMAEVEGRLSHVAAELASAVQAVIVCNQRIYPGVSIELGGEAMTIRTEGSGGRFACQDGEISWD